MSGVCFEVLAERERLERRLMGRRRRREERKEEEEALVAEAVGIVGEREEIDMVC
jgi:hypothetical protein